MKQKIFTIFDSKANAYLTPFFLHEDGMAIRVFADCVNNNNHQFGKHPEDYTLFNIGSWSDDKAKFLTNNPISLGNGLELKTPFDTSSFENLSDEDQIDFKEDWDKEHLPRKHEDPPIRKVK